MPFLGVQSYRFLKPENLDNKFPSSIFSSPIVSVSKNDYHLLKFDCSSLQLTIKMSLKNLAKDLKTDQSFIGSLFQDLRPELEAEPPIFSDAVLVCRGQEFHCHKLFLAARYTPSNIQYRIQGGPGVVVRAASSDKVLLRLVIQKRSE